MSLSRFFIDFGENSQDVGRYCVMKYISVFTNENVKVTAKIKLIKIEKKE